MDSKTANIVIGSLVAGSIILLIGTIGYIVWKTPKGDNGRQIDTMSILGIVLIVYLVIYFNTVTVLYLKNTWIFANYEHPVTEGTNDEFVRPFGVHTMPLENLCQVTTNSDGTSTVILKSTGVKVATPDPSVNPKDLTNPNSIASFSKTCQITCPDEFKYAPKSGDGPNVLGCMNTKKQPICRNGDLLSLHGTCA